MGIQRLVAAAVALTLLVGAGPAGGQSLAGAVAGKASDEAKKPYADYVVQLRDVTSGAVVNTQRLSPQGQFAFENVAVPRTYLVELVQERQKKIVCTEGPYTLSLAASRRLDVNISCGRVPAAAWLLMGAVAAVALTTRSASQ